MPDANSTAQLLQQIADRQQGRIREMNAIRAKQAAMPGEALSDFVDRFQEGRRAQNEQAAADERHQLSQAQLAQAGEQTKGAQIANRQALSEENLKDTVDPNDPKGRTYREEGPGLAAEAQRAQISGTQSAIQQRQQEFEETVKQHHADNVQNERASLDAHQALLFDQYEKQRGGLANMQDGPQKQQQIDALTSSYAAKGLPQSSMQAVGVGSDATANYLATSRKLANEQLFNVGPDGAALRSGTAEADQNFTRLQNLANIFQTYQSSHWVNGADALGSVNETAIGKNARENFARSVEQSDPVLAASIRDTNTPWDTVSDKMKDYVAKQTQDAQQVWNSRKAGLQTKYTSPTLDGTPNGQPNPEFKPAITGPDRQYQQVLKSLTPPPQGGASGPLKMVRDKRLQEAVAAQKNASGVNGAVAGPVAAPGLAHPPAPVGAPAAPGAPAPQGQPQAPTGIVIPTNDPYLGQ